MSAMAADLVGREVADILVGDNLTNVQAANARGGTPRTPIGENGMAKKAKRAMRREWTNENVRELKRHSREKTPVAKISKLTKRTVGALRQKAFQLNLSLGHRR